MGITQIMILKVLRSLKMAKSDCYKKETRDVEDTWMIKHSDNLKTKFSGQPGVRTALNDNAKADDFFP